MSCPAKGMVRAAAATGRWTHAAWALCGGVEEGATAADAGLHFPLPFHLHLVGTHNSQERRHCTPSPSPACAARGSVASPVRGTTPSLPPYRWATREMGEGRWCGAAGHNAWRSISSSSASRRRLPPADNSHGHDGATASKTTRRAPLALAHLFVVRR
jgi:hypothetical protein